MVNFRTLSARLLVGMIGTSGPLLAQQVPVEPLKPVVEPDPKLLLVKQPIQPPVATAPEARTGEEARQLPPTTPTPAPAPAAPQTPDQTAKTTDVATNTVQGGSGTTAANSNAPDVSDLLGKSPASTGVEVQRRNSIVADPRVRGWRAGQFLTTADGGLFNPARADLDSVVSKFDSGTLRELSVIKGPYSTLFGPGFSFIDIQTNDSPRYDSLQVHGRTSIGYQTNGQRWDGVQSVLAGDQHWGFRATYNILQGNDYRGGNGPDVPASFLSNNVNFALGLDLAETSRLEFKGFHVIQSNLEFPGLYFDVRNSQSDGYSVRYVLDDQYCFDRLTADFWYNSSTTRGDTQMDPKKQFVQKLLFTSFNTGLNGQTPDYNSTDPRLFRFNDNSNTRFAGRNLGYRLEASWGPKESPLLTVGTDLNTFGQELIEIIRLQQLSGNSLRNGQTFDPNADNSFMTTQRIPKSNNVDPGIFFQTQLPIGDKLKIKSGGRFDYSYSTSTNLRTITGNIPLFGPAPGPNGQEFNVDPFDYSSDPNNRELNRQFALFAGYIQAEYKVADHVTAVIAYGHSERAPTLTELYASGPFIGVLQQGTSRLIGDPNLKKEKLNQLDLGLRAEYECFQAGINGFYGLVDNYITYDLNKGGPGLTQVVFTNTNRASLSGGELFAQADATAWLTPFGTLSYVQGIDQTHRDNRRAAGIDSSRRDDPIHGVRVSETEALPQIPPLESRVGFRIHACTKQPRWQVEFSARMVHGQNNIATSLGEQPTAGFTTFDIRTYWRACDNWTLTAGVENLGDRSYREHLDPISGNNLGVGALYRPGTNFYFGSQVTY